MVDSEGEASPASGKQQIASNGLKIPHSSQSNGIQLKDAVAVRWWAFKSILHDLMAASINKDYFPLFP